MSISYGSTSISVMNFLGAPIGTVQSPSLLSEFQNTVEISLHGPVSGFNDLTVGMPYYTTTQGTLIPGQAYYGLNSYSNEGGIVSGVIFTEAGQGDRSSSPQASTIDVQVMAVDSYLGIAITPTTILLGK